MSAHGLLQELVLVYAIAVTLLVVAGRLRVPSIVALIVTGILAGPAGLAIISDVSHVEMLSEIGVALLLFMAGLDFSVGELQRVWRRVLVGGVGQVAVTGGLAAGLLMASGEAGSARLFVVGLFIALSSTAIVIKELDRLNHAHAPHGQLAIGVLLLQDLIVIAALVFAPMILGTAAGASDPLMAFLRFGMVLGGVLLASRLALPLLLKVVSATSREAFSVAVLLASVGTAWLTSMLGLSMAVGAFLGGLVLAESEFSSQVYAEVRPIRDLLASLFFVSLGMFVVPQQLLTTLLLLVLLACGLVFLKVGGAMAAFLAAGAPLRVAVAAALVLGQIGEFSFVLGRSALEAGVLTPDEWQLLLGASILTMAATPSLVGMAPEIGARLGRRSGGESAAHEQLPALTDHVIILGYGIGGRLLARALGELATPYLVLEMNGANVREGRAKGEPIFYADATVPEPLQAAGVTRAAAVVAMLSDPDATARAVHATRSLSATVPVIVRARYRLEAERLKAAGASLAIAEELEGSLEVLAQLLSRLNIPGNVVEVLLETYRRTTMSGSAQTRRAPAVPFSTLPEDIADTPVATFRIAASMWGTGRSLAELNLRADTGATVLAVRRGTRTVTSPDANFRLQADDDLYLMGDDADVRLARHRLETGGTHAAQESLSS